MPLHGGLSSQAGKSKHVQDHTANKSCVHIYSIYLSNHDQLCVGNTADAYSALKFSFCVSKFSSGAVSPGDMILSMYGFCENLSPLWKLHAQVPILCLNHVDQVSPTELNGHCMTL